MSVRYLAATAQGSGDGSSAANAAAWTAISTQIGLAAAGSAPYEVRLIKESNTYTWATSGQLATITAGGADATKRVVVHGWSMATGAEAYVTITGSRSSPYVPPTTNNDDTYQPSGSNGDAGLILLNLATGADHIEFAVLSLVNMQSLFRVQNVVNDVCGRDIIATNCRRLWSVDDSTFAAPTGIKGTSATPATWQRIRAFGFSKNLMYLSGCSYVTFTDIFGDSQGQAWDGNPALISLEGNTSFGASDHITINRWEARNMVLPVYTATPRRYSLAPSGGAPTGGTFTLSYNAATTAPIAYNASAATVKQALAAIGGLDTTVVFASGGPLPTAITVSIGGYKLASDPGAVTLNAGGLTGGSLALTVTQAYAAIAPGYWQGDAITTEEYDTAVTIKNGKALTMGDAGCDLKSTDTVVKNVTAQDCKRSFRAHQPSANGNPVVLERCRSIDPQLRAYAGGYPLAATAGTGTQCVVQGDGPIVVHDLVATEAANVYAADTKVIEADSVNGVITLIESNVQRRTGSALTYTTSSGSVAQHDITDTVL